LGIPRQPSFQARHPDQHQADPAPVEDRAELLQARHLEPVHLVHQHQFGRIDGSTVPLGLVEERFGDRALGPTEPLGLPGQPVMADEQLVTRLFEVPPRRREHRSHLGPDRLADQGVHLPPQPADVALDLTRGVHDSRRVQDAPVARHLIGPEDPVVGVWVGRSDPVPIGVAAGRERLAHPGRAVAQPDVVIPAAGVAELAEPPIFPRLDEG
jgi:hypothetical protein